MVSIEIVLTSSLSKTRSARSRQPLAVVSGAFGAAALTALVFLIRAGAPDSTNWPVHWELRSSDNGTLFQLLTDVVAGRPLEWSFSPQVFVFPELPISALAFVLAGADVYRYYLWVAVLNNVILWLALYVVVRLLWRGMDVATTAARASIAFVPLVVLPAIGTSWIFSFHLAPTYYFGEYAVLLGGPALYLVRSAWARWSLAAAIALTVASNPLVLVFAGPSLAIAALLVARRDGWSSLRGPAILTVGVAVAAAVVRLAIFSRLQGLSPLDYIDFDRFSGRLAVLGPYFAFEVSNSTTAVVLVVSVVATIVVTVVALVNARTFLATGAVDSLFFAWAGLVPVLGLAATFVLLITHQLYVWPIVVAPLVWLGLLVPARWIPAGSAVAAVGLIVTLLATGLPTHVSATDRYFGFRNAETQCLDERLPDGVTTGYATFSDARRLSLTSQRGVRLIALKSDGSQATWLANLDYIEADAGDFFYLNRAGDELVIDPDFLVETFGLADSVIACDGDREIWIYDDPVKQRRIAEHFGVRQPSD